MLKEITVKIIKEGAKAPTRAVDSIGYDLYSYEDVTLPAATFEDGVFKHPGKAIVSTGISVAFDQYKDYSDEGYLLGYKTYGAFIWDRSSMGAKTVKAYGFHREDFGVEKKTVNVFGNNLEVVSNFVYKHAGCIEGTYRGEWKVILVNLGSSPYSIAKGDRIAQVVFQEVETPSVSVIEYEDARTLPCSIRGDGGFGSTGK